MKHLPFILLSGILSFASLAGPLDLGEWGASDDLRLYLPDARQERRTTSLNWADLPTEEKAEVVVSKRPAPRKFRIVVDAGHGGKDLGAVGRYGVLEKHLCLGISRMVRDQLRREFAARKIPVEIIMSRDRDVYLTLRDRVHLANNVGADLFLSIHGNSSEHASVKGFEVYFLASEASDGRARALARVENSEIASTPIKPDVLSILSDVKANQHISESSRFAEVVFRAMSRSLHANGRGVRQAPFTVLDGTAMPALLIEVGYLTHWQEALWLGRGPYLKRLSNAISSGVVEYALTIKDLG